MALPESHTTQVFPYVSPILLVYPDLLESHLRLQWEPRLAITSRMKAWQSRATGSREGGASHSYFKMNREALFELLCMISKTGKTRNQNLYVVCFHLYEKRWGKERADLLTKE